MPLALFAHFCPFSLNRYFYLPTMLSHAFRCFSLLLLGLGLALSSSAQCLVDAGPDVTVCPGDSVQIGMMPQVGGYNYLWTPSQALSSPIVSNPFAFPDTTTDYVLQVFGPGCPVNATDTVRVTVLTPPIVPVVYNFDLGNGIQQDSVFKVCSSQGSFTLDLNAATGYSLSVIPGIDSFTVNWGNGTIQTGLTTIPSTYTYTQKGLFTLTITSHGSNGCTNSRSYPVVFQSNPAVGIGSPGSTEGCIPSSFTFYMTGYTSNPPGTYYVWDFGDGSPLVTWPYNYPINFTDSILHTFTTTSCGEPGDQFIVRVLAINECDTTIATVNNINIYQAPVADFEIDPDPPLGCTDTTEFCFTNTTIPGTTDQCTDYTQYIWEFGDGTIFSTNSLANNGDACHTYTQVGTYTVTLKAFTNVSTCDTSVISKTVRVNAEPQSIINASDSTGCVPLEVTFDGSASTGGQLSYRWEVMPDTGWTYVPPFHADSVITKLRFTVPASYQVKLITENNCGIDTAVFNVVIGGAASIALDPIPGACDSLVYLPTVILDTAYGNLSNIMWSFPGGNPSSSNVLSPGPVTYNTPGFYLVTVTTITSCDTLSASRGVSVYESPTAFFVADTICQGQFTQFQDSSAPGTGTITNWFWDFGDGATATTSMPQHQYNRCGTYQVLLRVTNSLGCSDSVILPVVVYCRPDVGFTADTVCQGFATTLVDTSRGTNGAPINRWLWVLPDGTNLAVSSFTQQFDTCGSFRVSLLAYDSLGCANSANQQVYIYCPPQADFSAPAVCEGDTTDFLDQSINGDGLITQWRWSLGNPAGDTSLLANPQLLYDSCGTYPVQLQVGDENGCADTTAKNVAVWCPPVPILTADTVCEGTRTTFQTSAAPGSGTLSSWAWDFGDGSSSLQFNGNPVSHTYPSCGSYTVSLSMTDANGCTASSSLPVFVRCLPQVGFSANSVCLGDSMYFVDQSSSSNGSLTGWIWDFGNMDSSFVQNPAHLYPDSGFYQVSLSVTDSSGCQATDSQQVRVFPLPTIDLVDSLVALCGQSIPDTLSRYILSASDPGRWSGPIAVGSQWLTRADSSLGAFDPSLLPLNTPLTFYYTTTNRFGCQQTDSLQLVVGNAVAAEAGPDTVLCADANPYDLNRFANPPGGQWVPQGGGLNQSLFDPSQVGPGNYSFYYVVGNGTCQVRDSLVIRVNPPVLAHAGPDQLFCFGDSVQIGGTPSGSGGTAPYQYQWLPTAGLDDDTLARPFVRGINSRRNYSLRVTDAVGCAVSDSVLVVENPALSVEAGPSGYGLLWRCNSPNSRSQRRQRAVQLPLVTG
jgi:PKD repeat protein